MANFCNDQNQFSHINQVYLNYFTEYLIFQTPNVKRESLEEVKPN